MSVNALRIHSQGQFDRTVLQNFLLRLGEQLRVLFVRGDPPFGIQGILRVFFFGTVFGMAFDLIKGTDVSFDLESAN